MNYRAVVTAVCAVAMMAGLSTSAAASPPHEGCPIGPGRTGTADIGAWELMDQDEFEIALEPTVETDPEAVAAAVFAKGDRNGDGYLCVTTQVLPNDASGSDTWLVARDNVANASK